MGKAPLIFALALLFAPRSAESAEASQSGVSVTFRDCAGDPVGRSVFFGALALELPPAEHGPTEIDVSLACDGIAQIRIRVGAVERARAVRFDDVPAVQRARALALVVAELFRSAAGETGQLASDGSAAVAVAPGPDPARTEPAKAESEATKPAPAASAPALAAANPDQADSGGKSGVRALSAERGLRASMGASLRFTPHATSWLWGVDVGVELSRWHAQAEVSWARSEVERGSITSGIGAVRVGPRFELSRSGRVTLAGGASLGGGVTWAVGDLSVPGTVTEVLLPYVDARLELVTSVDAGAHFRPDVMLYGGCGSGIDAKSYGRVEQSTGGCFAGLRLGAAL